MNDKLADLVSEVTKSAPPIAVLAASGGYSLQDWVYIATLGYIVLQGAWLLWRWYRAAKTKGWRPND